MRIDHAQVEGREKRIRVGNCNKHGIVDSGVSLIDFAGRLVCVASVVAGDCKRCVGQVELGDPGDKLGGASRGGGDVAVVRANSLAGLLPCKVEEPAREGEWLRTITGDAGRTRVTGVLGGVDVDARLVANDGGVGRVCDAFASDLVRRGVVGSDAVGVGLIVNGECWEVLPCETRSILWAGADVGRQVCPGPGLGDAGLEPYRLGRKAKHLAERDLLAGLGGNG